MGPARMNRMVEMSVLLGIKSHGLGIGHKKRARGRASLHPKRQVTLARGWSLDQIPQPRKGLKGPINPPSLFELRRGKPGLPRKASSGLACRDVACATSQRWRPRLDFKQYKETR